MQDKEQQTYQRSDIAGSLQIETVKRSEFVISSEQLPWLDDEASAVQTAVVESPVGNYQIGNIIGANKRLQRLADKEMEGKHEIDDKLNRVMHQAIQQVVEGNPGSVKRLRNAPQDVVIFYAGSSGGSRVFFVDAGTDQNGARTFLKAGVGASKNAEPTIISILSGRGRNKEAVK